MTPHRFPIRIGRHSQLVLLLFGVRPANAYVDLGGDELNALFGFFRFRTPTSNLASWRIEGLWRWITSIGVRFSVRHHDLTFGGTNRGGVRVDFMEPVSQLRVCVPALYVTFEDTVGFAAALAERGLPGADTRRPARPRTPGQVIRRPGRCPGERSRPRPYGLARLKLQWHSLFRCMSGSGMFCAMLGARVRRASDAGRGKASS